MMIAFLKFSIHTAGLDELFAGGDDDAANISTTAHHTANETHAKF